MIVAGCSSGPPGGDGPGASSPSSSSSPATPTRPASTPLRCPAHAPVAVAHHQQPGTASTLVPGHPDRLLACRYHGLNQPEPAGSPARSAHFAPGPIAARAQCRERPAGGSEAPLPGGVRRDDPLALRLSERHPAGRVDPYVRLRARDQWRSHGADAGARPSHALNRSSDTTTSSGTSNVPSRGTSRGIIGVRASADSRRRRIHPALEAISLMDSRRRMLALPHSWTAGCATAPRSARHGRLLRERVFERHAAARLGHYDVHHHVATVERAARPSRRPRRVPGPCRVTRVVGDPDTHGVRVVSPRHARRNRQGGHGRRRRCSVRGIGRGLVGTRPAADQPGMRGVCRRAPRRARGDRPRCIPGVDPGPNGCGHYLAGASRIVERGAVALPELPERQPGRNT